MRRAAVLSLAAGAAFAAACSDIGGPGVPVGIEALVPVPAVIQLGDTIRLRARAVDQNGDSVDAVIHWRTADTTVALDSTTGLVSGRFTGSAKLQPLAGTLVGPMVTFSVTRRADTVVVDAAAESLFVAIADSASAQLLPLVADHACLIGKSKGETRPRE